MLLAAFEGGGLVEHVCLAFLGGGGECCINIFLYSLGLWFDIRCSLLEENKDIFLY